MNQRNNVVGVGRLSGRSEVDAGLMRYRELLSRPQHAVAKKSGSRLGRIFRSRASARRAAVRAITAAALLVLVLSVAGAAEMSVGCLFLTPGTGAGGISVASIEAAPGLSILATGGTFELTAAGWSFEQRVARYNGELCIGPYYFAP